MIAAFWRWLEKTTPWPRAVNYSFLAVIIIFLFLQVTARTILSEDPPFWMIRPPPLEFLAALASQATGEDVLFRLLPIALIRKRTDSRLWLILTIVASSLVFGYLHDSFFNIAVQGGAGLLFSLLFLKCGGMQGRYLKALAYTSIVHTYVNILATMFEDLWPVF